MGFNKIGWLFVYPGGDSMYRFDEQGRLRRAFVDGYLYRTEGRTLAMMERQRAREHGGSKPDSESVLLRRDLSPNELEQFRIRVHRELDELTAGLRNAEITRQHPADSKGLVQEFAAALRGVLESQEFLAPAIVRR